MRKAVALSQENSRIDADDPRKRRIDQLYSSWAFFAERARPGTSIAQIKIRRKKMTEELRRSYTARSASLTGQLPHKRKIPRAFREPRTVRAQSYDFVWTAKKRTCITGISSLPARATYARYVLGDLKDAGAISESRRRFESPNTSPQSHAPTAKPLTRGAFPGKNRWKFCFLRGPAPISGRPG